MKLLHNHRILCYICVIVIAGVLLHDSIWGRTELEEPMSMQGQSEGASMTLTGEVYQIEQKEYSQYIYLEEQENKWLLYDSTFQELALGNTIMITGQLELFDVARNPGNFDIKEYYNKQGIVAGVSIDSIEIVNASVYPIREFLYQIKTTGIEQIYGILGEEQGGILVAMIFGETSGMDADQKELYQKVGISHIFAISGLHISLLSLVVYQLLRRLTGSIAISGIIGGVLLACYVVMIGFGVSAIRASVMFLLRIGADISGRVYDIRISLAVAALCILVPNPNYLYDCGFLMSFGAIIGVIYFVPIWQEVLEKIIIKFEKHKYYKILKHMSEGLAASLGIQCMIMPVLLYYYYEISPYSILLNLLVIPLMTILLGVAMLGLLGSFIWYGIGVVLLGFSGWLLQIIELAGEVTLSLIFSRIISGKPWFLMMILYYVCLLFLLGYWSFIRDADGDTYTGTKKQRIVAMGILVLPGLLWIQPAEYSYPQITMLDIGQGDCFYIRGPEGTDYLIDGGSSDISEVGKYRIEPYLRSIG
ncbi:MAG: ComEC/Rec2 family competence protein, partial [Eubacteriales bacterium]